MQHPLLQRLGPAVPARSWPRHYLPTYPLHATSQTQQGAQCSTGYLSHTTNNLLSTRSKATNARLRSSRPAAGTLPEVQATPAQLVQMQTFDANDVYASITGSASCSPRFVLHSRFRSRFRRTRKQTLAIAQGQSLHVYHTSLRDSMSVMWMGFCTS